MSCVSVYKVCIHKCSKMRERSDVMKQKVITITYQVKLEEKIIIKSSDVRNKFLSTAMYFLKQFSFQPDYYQEINCLNFLT